LILPPICGGLVAYLIVISCAFRDHRRTPAARRRHLAVFGSRNQLHGGDPGNDATRARDAGGLGQLAGAVVNVGRDRANVAHLAPQ
jgi:hypothetical protein